MSFADSLVNLISGIGGPRDKAAATTYGFSEITQDQLLNAYRGNWLVRKIVDIPPKDATREWRQWQASNDQIELLEAEEARLSVASRIKDAMTMGRLYGGAVLLLVTKNSKFDMPLDPERIRQGELLSLIMLNRYEVTPEEIVWTLESPYYGYPEYFRLPDGQRVHATHLVRFIGSDILDRSRTNGPWGDSVLQCLDDPIKHAGITSAGVAHLIHEAKNDIIHIPNFLSQMGNDEYRSRLIQRFQLANMGKSMVNATLLDSEEQWERLTTNFSTLPQILETFLSIVSGAADIPATRLLGQSPAGMNSTGESDIRNYYDRIASEQELVMRPLFATLDEVLIRSALGSRPPEVHYEWKSLWQLDDTEQVEVWHKKAQVFEIDLNAGLIDPMALAIARQNQLVEDGVYPGLEEALEEWPLAEDDVRSEPDDRNEPEDDDSEENDDGSEDDTSTDVPAADASSRMIRDVRERTLFACRRVINIQDFRDWAEAEGFELAPDLHVTLAYSKIPFDWMKIPPSWTDQITIEGGPRVVEPLGDVGAALFFVSTELTMRWRDIVDAGAHWDYPDYQPHVTVSIPPVQRVINPYRGKIVLDRETFDEIV